MNYSLKESFLILTITKNKVNEYIIFYYIITKIVLKKINKIRKYFSFS